MLTHLRQSVVFAIICLVVFGFVYALAGTGLAQGLFSHQANGSLTANGSTLIGQTWSSPKYFHGRPDGDNPLENNGSSGETGASNLGPRSRTLLNNTKALVQYWHRMGVDNPTPDLVTTSGSGIDPDITPADAMVQIPMVSKATGISPAALGKLIARERHSAQWGFLGSDYINVLELNEALAKME